MNPLREPNIHVWEFPLMGYPYAIRNHGENMSEQTEHPYKGAIIKRVPHTGLMESSDTMGFVTPHAYQVVDDFGELAMPEILQQKFWSPYDAAMAWDLYRLLKPLVRTRDPRTGPMLGYEFGRVMAMRRHMHVTIAALRELETVARNADDFGELVDPAQVLNCTNAIRCTRGMG